MSIAKLKNGVEMYYEIQGRGEPFILINGLKSDHSGWIPILDTLAKHFQIIILDNRAIGQTKDDGKSFTIKNMANDVIQLMEYLHINSAVIAGHSMGGAIAQEIAYHYPKKIKKVFLCNTFLKFNETSRQAFENIRGLYKKNASRSNIMDEIIPWVFTDEFATPEFRSQIHSFVEADILWQSKDDYERQLNALNLFDSSEWIKKINVPTIVIGSIADKTALLEESELLAKKIPGAQLEILDGGHASAVEKPKALSDYFMKHLCQYSV